MTNLFVDCDDTLFLYLVSNIKNPHGLWKNIPYKCNEKLIQGIQTFRREHPNHKEHSIYIWSGGGWEYARMCAVQLGISSICNGFLTKDITEFHRIKEGDIVIDDDDLVKVRTHTPFNWPEE